MDSPLVGIALAVYRPDPAAFREQLASIRDQTYPSWRCVLTADSPLAPLRAEPALAPFFEDARFSWHENPERLGVEKNFARAIGLCVEAGAVYVACSDQDDVWYPHKLATLVRAIASKPPLSLVHADMDVLVDGEKLARSAWELEGRTVDRADPTSLLVRNVATGAAMLMDAELARRYPRVPEGALFHDHWYAFVASLHGGVHPVRERLHAYRQHAGNVIGVRAYRGLLDGMGVREMLAHRDDAVRNYRARRAIALAAQEAGHRLSRVAELAFTRGLDGGLVLFGMGAASLGDRTLARECFALGAGKALAFGVGEARAGGRTGRSRT
jgi:hypothetical protein